MTPEIKTISPKKIIGMCCTTSMANDNTPAMWREFMPRKKEIKNNANTTHIAMQVFDASIHFSQYTANTLFTNWAAIEVTNFDSVPQGMQTHTIAGGRYVVYMHKGDMAKYFETRLYIMSQWIPAQGYVLDDREYFEILDERYKGNHPQSEEEVWIPIK